MATINSMALTEGGVAGAPKVAHIELTLASGEIITSVKRWNFGDQYLEIGSSGWSEAVPASELPYSAPSPVTYDDICYGYGRNMWEFGISDGTTTTYLRTEALEILFDNVLLRSSYQTGGAFTSTPGLGIDDLKLLSYRRAGVTQNLVHSIPGRTGRPLVKYRTGQNVTSTVSLMVETEGIETAEFRLRKVEEILGAPGELIIRRPQYSAGISYVIPDVRGMVQSYSVYHGTVPNDTAQDQTVWFVDVTLVESRDYL